VSSNSLAEVESAATSAGSALTVTGVRKTYESEGVLLDLLGLGDKASSAPGVLSGGQAIMLVTQDDDDVAAAADRIVRMRDGRLEGDGEPAVEDLSAPLRTAFRVPTETPP